MLIKIQEYLKINGSGVSVEIKLSKCMAGTMQHGSRAHGPRGAEQRQAAGRGVLLGLPGFYRLTPGRLHFNIETCQPQKKMYLKKSREHLVSHMWSSFFSL